MLNISEGRRREVLSALAAAAGSDLLDLHADPEHHRAVVTVVGEAAPRAVTLAALEHIDLRDHAGAHPRLGAVDVVPFVALAGDPAEAREARDRFGRWLGQDVGVPALAYGDGGPSLPELRRHARHTLAPDFGPPSVDPRSGVTAVGARPVLVAYNLWLAGGDSALAAELARGLRGAAVRALGFELAGRAQVSMNLLAPLSVGPAAVYDRVAALARVERAEVVGLVPEEVLAGVAPARWDQLGLSPEATIEARLASAKSAGPRAPGREIRP